MKFTGKFSLLSLMAVLLFCWLVYAGDLPWWSIFIAWLYQMDFLVVDLKILIKWMKEKFN